MHEGTESLIRAIVEAFGSYDQAAKILKTPKSTVYFWVRNENIPHWRRGDILKAAKRRKVKLTEQQLEYLKSEERFPTLRTNDHHCSGMSEDQQHYILAARPYEKE